MEEVGVAEIDERLQDKISDLIPSEIFAIQVRFRLS